EEMTKPYSLAFKQRMVQRLTGKNAVSASQLARETGVRQQNLSRWLEQARSLPLVAHKLKPMGRDRSVDLKGHPGGRLQAHGGGADGLPRGGGSEARRLRALANSSRRRRTSL